MAVTGLLHVNVEVTDVDRALRFYRLFGLDEIERTGTPGRQGAWLQFPDGKQLHISLGPAPVAGRAHFAIEVNDLAAIRSAVEDSGAPIEHERTIAGINRFFTRDPDGNRIEIQQRVG